MLWDYIAVSVRSEPHSQVEPQVMFGKEVVWIHVLHDDKMSLHVPEQVLKTTESANTSQ